MRIAFWLVILFACASLLVLVFSLTSGTMVMIGKLSDATVEHNPLENDVFTGYFQIKDVRYFERELLQENYTFDCGSEIIVIDLIVDNRKLPDQCEIFVDRNFIKAFTVSEIPCQSGCTNEEIIITESIRRHRMDIAHEVEICCEGICHQETLEAKCDSQQLNSGKDMDLSR